MVARKLTSPIINDLSHVEADLDATLFLERRFAYDANDNVIYQGYARPGTAAGALGWFIIKNTWGAGTVGGFNLTLSEVSDDEVKFDKEWDERTTYFA